MSMVARDRAVVLGGSIAGLLTARVLADSYPDVTIVERDRLPAGARHRRGVPQGRHFHGLLPGGRQVMEELLPGLSDGLIARGAVFGDVLGNVRWYQRGRMLRQADIGLTVLSASRPLIESAVRERVLALPNVRLRDGHAATGLRLSPDRQRVTGVRVGGTANAPLPADLVVDATGRGSRVRRWLGESGYPAPPTERVSIDLWYVSCTFAAPPTALGDDIMVAVARLPDGRRSGVMQRVEGDRVMVTLAGIRGDRPPLDPDGFASYAGTLAAPDIYQLVRSYRALAAPVQFHCPTYERHRHERVADFPAGLLLVGDAVCSFNPVYAEGISVAARTAAMLGRRLRDGGEPAAGPYFRAVGAILDAPWGREVAADLTDVSVPSSPASRPSAEYLAELELAAAADAQLATAFVRVAALVDPPSALLSPAVRRRVARAGAAPLAG